MDNFIGQASSSMSTYIALFVIMILALIFKVALWYLSSLVLFNFIIKLIMK
jgi:hypothetical protein